MITLDTSGVLALLSADDRNHRQARSVLQQDRGPYIVPCAILGEAAFMLERELSPPALDAFLGDIESGGFTLDFDRRDLQRARILIKRYADLRLGFVDAAVIACAERNGGRVLTLDLRHFGVVAREGTLTVFP